MPDPKFDYEKINSRLLDEEFDEKHPRDTTYDFWYEDDIYDDIEEEMIDGVTGEYDENGEWVWW